MFFTTINKKHLNGYKELTFPKTVIEYNPQEVAIALQHGNSPVECKVKAGDYVKIGDLIGLKNDFFYVPFFSSISGRVKAIEKRQGLNLKMTDYVVIENDFQNNKADLKTLDYVSASKEEIVSFIKEKGILGCGGAGFPTYFKYQTDKCDTLIINAVECEPYISADAASIISFPQDFKTGLKALFKASGAKRCLIGVKENKRIVIDALKELISDLDFCQIVKVKDAYPMGWERSLVYALTKKEYTKLPIEAGVIISNATTVIMCGKALKTGLPIYRKIITVSGDAIKEPHNILTPVGTIISELIACCGGYKSDKVDLIAGGPMMGTSLNNDTFSLTSYSNAITVLAYKAEKEMACLRCTRCIDYCPAGLMPVQIMNTSKSGNIERLQLLHTLDCIECGMCSYVCPSKIAVTDHIRKAKKLLLLRVKH